MYPGARDLYPLLDWQEGGDPMVTHGSSDAPRRRRTLTSAGATSSSSRARSRSTGKSAAAGSPLRAPGGARRKRDFGRARVGLRSIVGSTLCSRPRSAEARPSSVGLVRSYASRNTGTSKGHGDCTPFMGACGCTPSTDPGARAGRGRLLGGAAAHCHRMRACDRNSDNQPPIGALGMDL